MHTLKLIKDTITITTQLKSKFSGNNLENFDGHIELTPIRIVDPRDNYLVDSIDLSSSGKGDSRILALKSDVADGSIKGSFDWVRFHRILKRS